MFARLILHAEALGYRVSAGDMFRDSRATFPYGKKGSFHGKRLAGDLNLFKRDAEGVWRYQTTTAAHEPLGRFWQSMGGTWGGDFERPDGNHYSLGETGRM